MRPPRVIAAVAFFATTIFLTFLCLRASHPPSTIPPNAPGVAKTSRVQSLFSFRTAFSLFPPNAIITLTHDNTTAFLARPANFGPPLPSDGLRGQVWIGSGFGDDGLRQGAVASGAEGELGCSDVPGWGGGFVKPDAVLFEGGKSTGGATAQTAGKPKPQKRSDDDDGPLTDRIDRGEHASYAKGKGSKPPANDGTDDYLHHPLPESMVSKPNEKTTTGAAADHADIQSIQEGAEIAGKIVLLSRGGCGFLEKVKWAQRRGAIALIVGDDTAGGPLIQMYARGDTSNVTIPSIFTSRTTAHLLSSLIGPGSFIKDVTDETGKPAPKSQHTEGGKGTKKQGSRPTFTPIAAVPKVTGTARVSSKTEHKKLSVKAKEKTSDIVTDKPGWLKSLFSGKESKPETQRPPSSGRLDWVLVDEWKDEDEPRTKKISTQPSKKTEEKTFAPKTKPATEASSGDDFVIGVQDWRDPDLVGSPGAKDREIGNTAFADGSDGKPAAAVEEPAPNPAKAGRKHLGGALQEIPDFLPPLRGGSITPGSGEYSAEKTEGEAEGAPLLETSKQASNADGKPKGLLTTIFGDDEENVEFLPNRNAHADEAKREDGSGDSDAEGLWVTLTPTSGASPFLDTLLVLVVSPLATLTVVYALLLIRSRIRRRRWRAPKSVVERLPVRTYQTMLASGRQSPRTPSPNSSSASTPLLHQSSPNRPRPRSRTTIGIPEPGDLVRMESHPLQMPPVAPRAPEHEKSASESSEWRKHMGRQVECVVCLEEYVDGVSRVMSLPCGHEFHVDCITPWLTTKRRTCPICKGDVVRSLARGSPSRPRYEPYHDDSDDDARAHAAEASDDPPSSARPIAGGFGSNRDVEQATPTRARRSQQPGSWRALLTSSLGSSSRTTQLPREDRDR